MSDETDALIKSLFGDSDSSHQKALWDDFVRVAIVILLQDFCRRQENSKQTAEQIIKTWRERIETRAEQEIEATQKMRESSVGRMFSSLIPDADRSRGALQDQLNDIEQILRHSLEVGL